MKWGMEIKTAGSTSSSSDVWKCLMGVNFAIF